jgi:hypothetical protein
VDFYICDPAAVAAQATGFEGTCTTGGVSAGQDKPLSQVGTTNTSEADSDVVTANKVGTWCFRAVSDSSTDPEYTDSSDARPSEGFLVTDTTGATSEQTWLPNDSATITSVGDTNLDGTLSFTLYDSANCTGTVLRAAETFTLTDEASPATRSTTNGASVLPLTDYRVTSTDTVSWKVFFDSSNPLVADSQHCESTALTITN